MAQGSGRLCRGCQRHEWGLRGACCWPFCHCPGLMTPLVKRPLGACDSPPPWVGGWPAATGGLTWVQAVLPGLSRHPSERIQMTGSAVPATSPVPLWACPPQKCPACLQRQVRARPAGPAPTCPAHCISGCWLRTHHSTSPKLICHMCTTGIILLREKVAAEIMGP